MRRPLPLVALVLAGAAAAAEPPAPLVTGLKGPVAVAVGPGGKAYVAEAGEADKAGTGAVSVVQQGRAAPFCAGLEGPSGLAAFQNWLYVIERRGVLRIDARGKADVFVPANAFTKPNMPPRRLVDLTVDPESGLIYASADDPTAGPAIYRVTPQRQVSVVSDGDRLPAGTRPGAVRLDGASHLLLTDSGKGVLYRLKIADGTAEKLADGLGGAAGLAWDHFGRLVISDRKDGKLFVIGRPGEKPLVMAEGLKAPVSLCLAPGGKAVLVADATAGTLTSIPVVVPGAEVDERPLAVTSAVAFPDLKWTGWQPVTPAGKPNPLRPLVLTHCGDGSNRVFVATQHGVIHVFPNDQKADKTAVFLDIQERVKYADATNEEGFLGLAFHPKYRENGEFFVFYTPKKEKMVNVVSRFKVSKDDPNKADPASEVQLLRYVNKPFWNHDGGTVCFGPDGFLYVFHGDGGDANDPFDNGQNLKSLFGKVLRIDVDRKDEGKEYAVPRDNPFVGRADALPEIWAYGLRNVWRMAFDRKTGRLWAADVGQNLYEEIDLIEKGGNYGWNRREGLHPFGRRGVGPRKEHIEPIWEYHHDVGKSITGGTVYRGPRLPELEGHYLYGDYVSGRIWALKYDEAKGRVVANRPIKDRGVPLYSFGEDEKGEVYWLTATPDGKGIFWFVKSP
jgi:glucose/arabinose dehydrogenase